MLTSALCGLTLWVGWRGREEYYLTPEAGLGYGLGIAGLAMMLLLLLYSVRKRAQFLRNAGSVRIWFHVHMALGLMGPTAILLHSDFHLGSQNANVALACMLLVSSSGVVGRFIYTKVHHELFGRKQTVSELRLAAETGKGALASVFALSPELTWSLTDFERAMLEPKRGFLRGAWRFCLAAHAARRTRRRTLRAAGRALRNGVRPAVAEPLPDEREIRDALTGYIRALRRVAEFEAYERAFSLWHVLHLPLCVLLFAAAVFHVIAVHMY
jgi:hypothetical protein